MPLALTLRLARQHAAQGRRQLERQRRLVADLIADGHSAAADQASDVLATMEESVAQLDKHIAHLERLIARQDAGAMLRRRDLRAAG